MIYRIVIEPTAERGIRESIHWLHEQASLDVAAKWLNGLNQAIDSLKTFPGRGSLVAENDKFPVEVAS
jgi:plasmid stabilization system protein ParE